jgi:type IV secretory pathway TraG/TraD family ATPase VirD4
MARAACMTALLACVSPLAIGTAHAFELSAPDDTQTADIVTAIVVLVCAYGGFQGLRRGFRGAGSAFWTSTLGRWLIGRIAGTLVFGGLFGTGFFLAQRAAVPLLDVLLRLGVPFSSELLCGVLLWMWGGPVLFAWYLRTAAKVCIGKSSHPLRRLIRSLGMGGGGSSAFAGIFEEWGCRWKPGMILLGSSMFDSKWLVGVKDDRHQVTISSTGGGKGRSVVLPNLLTYPGSVLCVDVKGQNAAVTAERRRAMGQTVHVFDPMNAVEGLTSHYNPLAELDPASPDYAEQLDLIVDALVVPGGDKSIFWDESARIVIAGVLDYIVRAPAQRLLQHLPDKQESP